MYQTVLDMKAAFDLLNERIAKLEEKTKNLVNIIHIQDDKIYALECSIREFENIFNNNVDDGNNDECDTPAN